MLNPAGLRKKLSKLLLCYRPDRAIVIEDNRPRTARALVEGEDEGHAERLNELNELNKLKVRLLVPPVQMSTALVGARFAFARCDKKYRPHWLRRAKAAEDLPVGHRRTPRRVGDRRDSRNARSVVECGCPLPLF